MRPAAALLLSILVTFAVGCGGSGPPAGGPTATTAQPPAGSLEARLRAPGDDVAAVLGTSDYEPGKNRVSFLVVDKQSRLITTPTAKVFLSHGLKQSPFVQTTARSEPIGVPGGATADAG